MKTSVIQRETWGIIPARGGSKSIPLKNMKKLAGRPLIEYAIKAADRARVIRKLYCSTDHPGIRAFCHDRGVTVQDRPGRLSGDRVSTLDVILYFLKTVQEENGEIPEFLVLLEPTSPFVLPEHIETCVDMIQKDPLLDSTQTATEPPPNHHAYNQRFIRDGHMYFSFMEERKHSVNKQSKPVFYVHGNIRVFRSLSLLRNQDLFGKLSKPYVIPRKYALDADGAEDFELAECMIRWGMVTLPHLEVEKDPSL